MGLENSEKREPSDANFWSDSIRYWTALNIKSVEPVSSGIAQARWTGPSEASTSFMSKAKIVLTPAMVGGSSVLERTA